MAFQSHNTTPGGTKKDVANACALMFITTMDADMVSLKSSTLITQQMDRRESTQASKVIFILVTCECGKHSCFVFCYLRTSLYQIFQGGDL